jgi:hypothetical protein
MRAFRTMRRGVVALGAGTVLLLAGACGTTQAGGNPPASDTSTPTETTEPDRQPARTPPSGGTEVGAEQLDPTALPEGYPQLVWTEDDGRTVGAVAQEGGCGKAHLEVPEQSATQVVVTMVEVVPAESQICTMDLRYPKLTAELDEPLGDRTIVLKSEQRKG